MFNSDRKLLLSLLAASLFLTGVEGRTCNKIVLTGAPGAGKSSIIEKLKELGFSTRDEAFTTVFIEAKEKGELDSLLADKAETRRVLVAKQLEFEASSLAQRPLFLDRSLIDIAVFGELYHQPVPKEELSALANADYDLVFVVEPLPKDRYKQSEIRKGSYEKTLLIHEKLISAYQESLLSWGKKPKEVMVSVPFFDIADAEMDPSLPVSLRVEFVLNQVAKKCGLNQNSFK